MGLRRKYIRLLRWLRLVKRNRKMTVTGIINRTLRRCWRQAADNVIHGNYYFVNRLYDAADAAKFWRK